MRSAVCSLPKITLEVGQTGGLRFAATKEAMQGFLARTAGKILLVSDGAGLAALAPVSTAPRTLSVVLDGEDALPLFAMPDGVGGVIAAGGATAMRAARCYSAVHKIPCLLLPRDAALDGVFEQIDRVKIGGHEAELPLSRGEIVCDLAAMKPTLARAYARLLLVRLAAFEAKALARFGIRPYPEVCEKALCAVEDVENEKDVVCANALIRTYEVQNLPLGEGMVLTKSLSHGGELAAYLGLCTLYSAFFSFGRPRKYAAVRYRERAERAGCDYATLAIPTIEKYAERVRLLERMRETCRLELSCIVRQNPSHLRRFRALGGVVAERVPAEKLKILPELCLQGLSAVMRDFGLMDF